MVNGKRILADLKVFGRGYMRNKIGLFFGIIFPVILIVLFGAIFSNSGNASVTVYVQNQDAGPFAIPQMDVASQFVDALNHTGTLKLEMVKPSDNFTLYLADHSSSDGIIIPANFSANYLAGNALNLTVYNNPTSSTSGIVS